MGHNGRVTTSATYAPAARTIKRPNPVAVGTIVWLGSEVMFFAGLFAIYFTL
ncbi:heme-copper oxidase subunit III, partial [Pseudomonas sp. BGM005]|nr:heme-copper oxidase subunit III [Pseudomonas sp. BG5]